MNDYAAPASSEESSAQRPRKERMAEMMKQFRVRFRESSAHFEEWRTEARALYDCAAGKQWSDEDEAYLRERNRPIVTFNVFGKFLDAVAGMQINNRQEIKFSPREAGDVKVSELLTGAVEWARDLCAAQDDETDAFYDCILVGMGWLEAYMDRDIIPSGAPTVCRVDPMEMYPDPRSKKRNLNDARYVIRVKHVDADEFEDQYGTGEDTTEEGDAPIFAAEDEEPLAHVTELPQDYRGDVPGMAGAKGKRRPVADYQYWEREDAVLVSSQDLGQQVFSKETWRLFEPRLKAANLQYEAVPFKRRVYYRAIIAGNKVAQWGLSPTQNGFTFKGITGKRDRNARVWYGIGRSILDPQKWVNKFFATILYAMMTNAKGGLIAEENAFTDARRAEDEWGDPSSITWLKEGALQKGKIQPKPESRYPQGLDRLMQFSLEAMPMTSGLNLELLGLTDRIQAGVVEAQRKQAAMAIISWAFDGMRRYYREMGALLAEFVRKYIPDGTLVRISGEGSDRYVPLIKAELATHYDVIVDEAPTSVNQQERVWIVLQQIIPQLLQAGMAIPKEVLDYAPLPADLAQKWKEALQPDPKKQQVDERQMVEVLRGLMAENAQKESAAKLNEAKAAEILEELRAPKNDGNEKLQIELMTAKIEAAVEARIAEFKTNREAETKLLVEQMKIDSAERIAQMEAVIEAKLENTRIAAESSSKIAAASVTAAARNVQNGEGEDEDEEGEKEVPNATEVLVEVVKDLREAIKEMGRKPRGFKIERDKLGEMSRVIAEE